VTEAGVKMGELLRCPDEPESRPDSRWQGRLAASETVDGFIRVTNGLGASLEALLSSFWRLEEVSRGLDVLVGRLPAGEARQQIEHQQVLAKEQLVIVRKLLAGS
jgi:hypothetical protein